MPRRRSRTVLARTAAGTAATLLGLVGSEPSAAASVGSARSVAGEVAALAALRDGGVLVGIVGSSRGALFRLLDGTTWARIAAGPGSSAGVVRLAASQHTRVVYAVSVPARSATASFVLDRSDDGGRSWRRLGWPAGLGGARLGAPALAVDAVRPWVVLAASGGTIRRSGDAGRTWHRVGARLTVPVAPGPHSLVADGRRSGTFYVSTPRSGVFRTDDGGYRWRRVGAGLVDRRGRARRTALGADPVRAGAVYATDARGIFRSLDRGAHWVLVHEERGGLVAPVASGANVFVAGGRGLHVSDDGGTTWQEVLGPRALAPDHMALTARGALVVVTRFEDAEEGARCARVFRSGDGARSWVTVDGGLPLPRRRCWLYASRVG